MKAQPRKKKNIPEKFEKGQEEAKSLYEPAQPTKSHQCIFQKYLVHRVKTNCKTKSKMNISALALHFKAVETL